MEWDLQPGEEIKRTELHRRFGGRRQGGVAPSASSPNVMLFTDPAVGEQHGYRDRWEGLVFHYTGEGQRGDQRMTQGNRTIRDHVDEGRTLRLFRGSSGVVRYEGEFELDPVQPWYLDRAPATGRGPMRDVIMFRLVPVGEFAHQDRVVSPETVAPTLATPYRPEDEHAPERPERLIYEVDPNLADRGTRAHRRLQNELAEEARRRGLEPQSPGLGDPPFDLGWWQVDEFVVVEVKSITDANELSQLRLGLGQVLDYASALRAVGKPCRAVLAVEREPTQDRWPGLAAEHGVRLCWPGTLDLAFR